MLTIITNKHFGILNQQKTLYTNIAVNDLYDIKLYESDTVQCETNHLPQCWSEVNLNV